ncbi:MAG: protein kinase [Caulobacter sp.]
MIERQLRDPGAQADLYVVRMRSGGQRVVKLYRPEANIDEGAQARLVELDSPYVVRLFESGLSDPENVWFEVLEYVEGGSLADLIRREGPRLQEERVQAILSQIQAAITFLHTRLQIVHRDVKPQNILVRSSEPLSLVMADFGTVSSLRERSDLSRQIPRSVAYSAPEEGRSLVSYPADWWSLGMMLVEMLVGRHPFADPNGGLLEPLEIMNRLARDSVDGLVDGVPERWRNLCRGLLRGRPDNRWNQQQVTDWLLGGSPEVEDEPRGLFDYRPFAFAGQELWDRRQIAHAFKANWAEALEALGRGRLASWVRDELQDQGLFERLGRVDAAYQHPEARLLFSILELYPSVTPALRGHDIDEPGLARLAMAAAAESAAGEGPAAPSSASAVLELIYDQGLLTSYADHMFNPWHGDTDRRWRAQMRELRQAADILPAGAREMIAARIPFAAATGLAALCGPNREASLQAAYEALLPARARALAECDWLATILHRIDGAYTAGRGATLGALIAVVPALAPLAADPARRTRERRRQEQQRLGLRRAQQFGLLALVGAVVWLTMFQVRVVMAEAQRRGAVVQAVSFDSAPAIPGPEPDNGVFALPAAGKVVANLKVVNPRIELDNVKVVQVGGAAKAARCEIPLYPPEGPFSCDLGALPKGRHRFKVLLNDQKVREVTLVVGGRKQ